jgi:hypothetical protein
MLAPSDRKLLVDLLSPPEDYTLQHAIATTFTLDLAALLMIPLGFAGRDLSLNTNQIALLQTVREYSDRLDVFCQKGMVSVPQKSNQLLSFLEPVIHEVSRPNRQGIFHPKIWVLRFSPLDSDLNQPDRFRFICGSRNLTFDRSWDSFIALEGVETGRRHAYNNSLCKFLEALPSRAGGLRPDRQNQMSATVSALNNVKWEAPDGVANVNDWLSIHVFGATPSPKPKIAGKKMLVVSPFLNDGGIDPFLDCEVLHVISRGDQLNALGDAVKTELSHPDSHLYVINDAVALGEDDEEATEVKWELSGLHSKLYALERGHYTHVMIGSANATREGWSVNDEILVEIIGKNRDFGVDSMVGLKSDFRTILRGHDLGPANDVDEVEDLRTELERALVSIAEVSLTAHITGSDDEGWGETVSSARPLDPIIEKSELKISLMTDQVAFRVVENEKPLNESWQLSGVQSSTPFIVLTLSKDTVSVSTVVLATLTGGPEDRLDRIFAHHISRPELFLQLVTLLLNASDDESGISSRDLFFDEQISSSSWMSSGSGLLEQLLTALSRSPESIDKIGEMVNRLQATVEGRKVLPTGWDELWTSVKDAKALMESHRD